jgi:hypothetical protein
VTILYKFMSLFSHLLKPTFLISFVFLLSTTLLVSCNIGLPSPPTPGPFPDKNVRQMTFDYAFYESLLWSPNGSILTGTRCPVLNFEPACYEHEETVLIDVDTGELHTLDIQSITPNPITGYPLVWSPDGKNLLLLIREWFPAEGSAPSQPQSRKMSYNLDTGTYSEFEITGSVIAWSGDGTSLLMIRSVEDDLSAIGWYKIESGDFFQEIPLTEEDNLFWPYALSPSEKILLRSNSPSSSSCNEVESYIMGSHEFFKPFLSLACFPAWSPDGSRLAYTAKFDLKGLPNRLMIADADGSSPMSLFTDTTPHELAYPTWSPVGNQIAFTMGAKENANAIYIADVPE